MYNKSIVTSVCMWKWDNPPPANVMLISVQRIFGQCIAHLSEEYYVLGSKVPYDRKLEPTVFAIGVQGASSGKAYSRAYVQRPRRIAEEQRVNLPFIAQDADLVVGFESFTKHILSKQHALEEELDYYPGGVESGNESRAHKEDATAILARLQGFREARRLEEEEEEFKYKKQRLEDPYYDEEYDYEAEAE